MDVSNTALNLDGLRNNTIMQKIREKQFCVKFVSCDNSFIDLNINKPKISWIFQTGKYLIRTDPDCKEAYFE